jgi:hypothetical protein
MHNSVFYLSFSCFCCLTLYSKVGFEPRLALSYTGSMRLVTRLGEAATPEGGKCGPCPDFALYTLAFALQLKNIPCKTSIRVSERCLADQRRTRFVQMTWPLSSLDWPSSSCRPWLLRQATGLVTNLTSIRSLNIVSLFTILYCVDVDILLQDVLQVVIDN